MGLFRRKRGSAAVAVIILVLIPILLVAGLLVYANRPKNQEDVELAE